MLQVKYFLFLTLVIFTVENYGAPGSPYSLISKVQTDCELEALKVGSILADHYNSYDENTEWDARIHEDFLTQNLGFAGWIQMGTWKSGGLTATSKNAKSLHSKGGWAGSKNVSHSSYWALDNQWLYMMGDSTVRQIWATFVSPFQNNDFERNAKEWTRENCARQFPHRKEHFSGGHFPEEGWGGKCGNNEVTCHLSGFGAEGKISFDWKHFTYEDYDEWLWSEHGRWSGNDTVRRPDILTVHVGLHTCFHAYTDYPRGQMNYSLVRNHESELPRLMAAINVAISRPSNTPKTMVIIMTAGRIGNLDPELDGCVVRFNRLTAKAAHDAGFAVLEREEIERRLLFKSEYKNDDGFNHGGYMKSQLHLENPAAQIVGTSLLTLISCLRKNITLEHEYLTHHMTRSLVSPLADV